MFPRNRLHRRSRPLTVQRRYFRYLPTIALALSVTMLLAVAGRPVAAQPTSIPDGAGVWHASGAHAAVVTGGAEASAAAIEILKEDGNAVDGTVAALLVLCVTDSRNFCFGGEVPIMVFDAQRDAVEVLAGIGGAPRLATVEYFEAAGGIPKTGPQAAVVPGALDAMLVALDRFGTISFKRAAQPMLQVLAKNPDPWCRDLERTMATLIAAEQSTRDRKEGLRRVADEFYRGSIAQRISEWSEANGGLLRRIDFAMHTTRIDSPVRLAFRDFEVLKCGYWTQGPCLLQSLALLEGHDLKQLGHNQVASIHLTVEALKLAMADRDAYYGDPLFVAVPAARLLAPEYSKLRQTLLNPREASRKIQPGDPLGMRAIRAETAKAMALATPNRDTTTCLVADRMGNVVAATPSGWGGVFAGDTGVQLNTRLQSLNSWRGHPNCVEPGKRPRITLTPTLVLRDGKPIAAISVAGGDLQDQVSLQVLLNSLEFGLSTPDAVAAPRFSTSHHTGSFGQPAPKPASLELNDTIPAEVVVGLRALGHDTQPTKAPTGHPCLLRIDPQSGKKEAAGDPKANRRAAAY